MQKSSAMSLKTKLALIITIVLWASAFVGIRISLEGGYSPGGLGLLRFIIASVCLYAICLYLPKRPKIALKDKLYLLFIGGLTVGGYHIALNYGELTVNSGVASFIVSQSPVFTTLMAVAFLKERLHVLGVLGMVISFIGISFILLSHPEQMNFELSSFYVLIAAMLGSVYSIIQKHYLSKYQAIDITAYLMYGATILLSIYSVALSHDIFQASWLATWSVIYLGIFPAAVAYLGWGYVLARMPASRAVNFLYGMPVVATILGWICLSETPSWLALLGGLIALFGVWLLNHSYSKLAKPVMIEEQAITK